MRENVRHFCSRGGTEFRKTMNQPRCYPFDLFCSPTRERPDAVLCLTDHGGGLQVAASDLESVLHPLEREQAAGFGSQRRRVHYVAGRSVAKRALVRLLASRGGEGLPSGWDRFSRIHIANGTLGQPVLRQPAAGGIGVSIAHDNRVAAALAFDEAIPMAVDVEELDKKHTDMIWGWLTPRERELMREFKNGGDMCTALWTAKEALAKVLRAGLSSLRLSVYEVERCQWRHTVLVTHFCRIPAYAAVSFLLPCTNSWCGLALPRCVLNDDLLLQLQRGLLCSSHPTR
ncbi:MAG: 4'-phosphopantetheinyl transferase superfamily protein [Myxococcota bacterium]